ncbi:MAG: hypothetical protein U1E65_11955 [Myxococcota bacterium]
MRPETQGLLEQAKLTDKASALALAAEALTTELLFAMKTVGIKKSEEAISALKKTDLDKLLVRSMALGKVSHISVRNELDRLTKALGRRELSAQELKAGILAFDESAQRIALSTTKGLSFKYPTVANRARDSLITFARSLHR